VSLRDGYPRVNLQVEASKYMGHQLGLTEKTRHVNVCRGFRNWVATADRWRQRETERQAARGGGR
jgi:hypothetical protein